MENFLFILLIPVIIAFSAKRFLHHTITWKEMGVQLVTVTIVVSITWFAGTASMSSDTEVWNGQVISKKRVQDHYLDPYDCMCTTYSCGTSKAPATCETCQTCYEDRYTVDWSANTTVGHITFKHLDKGSKRVYQTPNPAVYTNCAKGQPVAREKSYTNYIKAVPDSLFANTSKANVEFKGKVPGYPRVHSFYQLNRVINVDSSVDSGIITALDKNLDKALISLGSAKQVNIIVIVTEIDDPMYRYEIERAWLGGKKNDVVIFMGMDGNKFTWIDEMTFAMNKGNELFHVTMRDGLTDIGDITSKEVAPFIVKTILELYDRPQMKEYEYLKDRIQPPTWVIILSLIFAIFGSAALTFWFHKKRVV